MSRRLSITVLFLFVAAALVGWRQDVVPTTRVANCTQGGCHASELDRNFLHGPVAAGACDACHVSVDEPAHTFRLVRTGAELCGFCHSEKTDPRMFLHEPVKQGMCLSCHDPHGSDHPMMLQGATTGAVCRSCHDSAVAGNHMHTPVAEGRCTDCHRAHGSPLPDLLVAQGRDLCARCHEPVIALAHPPEDTSPDASVHAPVLDDCRQCHDVHATDVPAMLTGPALALCTSCHEEVGRAATDAAHPHGIVLDDRACLHCHAPHDSPRPSLLNASPETLCLQCHGEPVERGDGTTVASVAYLADPELHRHGPVAAGACGACHEVHGGERAALLIEPYSTDMYEYGPVDTDRFGLCFHCHDRELVTDERTDTATDFRDGDRNLHFVHVNRDKGRSCRACHDAHAAPNAGLIQDAVPFGGWSLPIEFTMTETGGGCVPGCHVPYEYDRKTPVER